MEKLEIILSGYENENVVPSLFVFMGNFSSHPCNLSFNSYSSIRWEFLFVYVIVVTANENIVTVYMFFGRSQFGKLGKMIADHQRLKENSRFLFIPGPDDIGDLKYFFDLLDAFPYLSCLMRNYCYLGPSNALPRCSLPKYITEELQNHIPNAVFLSNPCRFFS